MGEPRRTGPPLLTRALAGLLASLACLLASPARPDATDPTEAGRRLQELAGTLQALPDTGSGISRDIGSIAVIEHDGSNYDRNEAGGAPNYAARVPVALRFYQSHGDNYDFLVVFTNFEFETNDARAFWSVVRNDVQGIGLPIVDNGEFFGSPGRLKGYIDMTWVARWREAPQSLRPGDLGFLETLNVLAHEVGHQWLARVRYADRDGQLSGALVTSQSHWSYLLDSGGSVMYGSDWRENPDGGFVAHRVHDAYSPLDLYLMGFLPAGKVAPFSLLRSPGVDPATLPEEGAVLTPDEVEEIGLGQVTAVEGERSPGFTAAQKDFRIGFVFLTRPGTEPTPEDLAGVDAVRRAFGAHFFAMTRGVGFADTSLAETPAPPPAPAPDLDRALAWLLSAQGLDGSWADGRTTAVRDTSAAAGVLREQAQAGLAVQRALAWLRSTAPSSTDFLTRRAAALAANALPAERDAAARELLAIQGADGGFGSAADYSSAPLDTALALRALKALGHPGDAAVRRALATLSELRSAAGGWPAIPGGETSTVATAYSLTALLDWKDLPESQPAIASGLVALLARRNPDGGFGESPSTPFATALALQVLLAAGAPDDLKDGAIAWLEASQREDGSWSGSAFETALVLSALKGGVAPNLVVPQDGLTVEPPRVIEGQDVQVVATVRNLGRTAAPATVARVFDGDPAAGVLVGEAAVPALDPLGAATVSFTFPTTDKPGTRTIFVVVDPLGQVAEAREDDNAGSRPVTVDGLLPDLVVGDLAVSPHPPEAGETAEITARVHNRGERASGASALQLTLGDPRQGGTVLGSVSVPPLAPGEAAVASLSWDTTALEGQWVLVATADARFAVAESDETNNEAQLDVAVVEQAPDGSDLAVGSAAVSPTTQTTVPQPVTVTASVHNLGRTHATARVALYEEASDDLVLLQDQQSEIGPRSAVTLTFSVSLPGTGPHELMVIADPDEELDDPDRGNNTAFVFLDDRHDSVDLEITAVEVQPAGDLTIGDLLTAVVTVRNRGTAEVAEVPVQLRLDGAALAQATLSLEPGETADATLAWATGLTGDPLSLLVEVDPFGLIPELSEANNQATLDVRVLASSLPNLSVRSPDVAFVPDPLREGQAAEVSATIRNSGEVAAGPFAVRFHVGDPDEGGALIGAASVPGVDAGGSWVATVHWPRVDLRGDSGVTVLVDPEGVVEEYDESDNRALRPFLSLGLPDLVLTAGAVVLEPAYPRAGETVSIQATILNLGAQASEATVLRVLEGEPDGGAVIAELPVPPIPPSAGETLSLAWDPAPPAGSRVLSLVVDPEGLVPEQDEGNAVVRRTVLVQDADLFLTAPFLSPDGDGVKDETALGYRSTGEVGVVVSDSRDLIVRRLLEGGPASGSVVWDGRDEQGRIVRDGEYTLGLLGAGGVVLARVQAVVDTNRLPIHDAAGTGRTTVRNVTCSLPDSMLGPAFMPGDQELLFIVRAARPGWPVGLVRVPLGGSPSYVVQDPSFAGATFASEDPVSPDGREVLLSSDGIDAVDLRTGARRSLGVEGSQASWSFDGRLIVVESTVVTRSGEAVGTLPEEERVFGHWAWSPDSERLARGTTVAAADGTILASVSLGQGEDDDDEEDTRLRFTTVWRGDGRIFVAMTTIFTGETCQGGDGICVSESAHLFDPEALSLTPLEWLDSNSDGEGLGAAGAQWSPDGTKALVVNPDSDMHEVFSADGSRHVPLLPFRFFDLQVSPSAASAYYTKGAGDSGLPGAVCPGKDSDGFLVQSAQNVVADVRAERLPGNFGILLKGTASDRHLERFELDYARSDEPETWHPIGGASEVPVVDDVLAAWVPPGPGTYLVRLRAEDAAGNVATHAQVVAWDRLPVFANVTQSRFLISPNDDGVKDSVAFNYLVLDVPAHLEVRIVGPEDPDGPPAPTVRSLAFDRGDLGPHGFVWDGRDEGGRVVPDGRYRVLLNDVPFRVDVDATPPELAFRQDNLRVAPDAQRGLDLCSSVFLGTGTLRMDRSWHVFDPQLKSWGFSSDGSAGTGGREPVYVYDEDASGATVVERGVPRVRRVAGRPVDVQGPSSVVQATAFWAEDHAGNRSVVPIPPVEELVFPLHAWILRGPPFCITTMEPAIDFVSGEPGDDATIYALGTRDVDLGVGYTLRGSAADADLRFQYRPESVPPAPWRDVLPERGRFAPDFAALGLHLGEVHQGRFAGGGEGGEIASEAFRFRTCDQFLKLTAGKPKLVEGSGGRLFAYGVGLTAALDEPIASVELLVDGGRLRLPMTLERPGRYSASIRTRGGNCVSPVRFEAVVRGVSGRVYLGDGENLCLQPTTASPACSLDIKQEFKPCALSSPDLVHLRVKASSDVPAHLTIEGGPESAPFPIASLPLPLPRDPDDANPGLQLVVDVGGRPEGVLPVRGIITFPDAPEDEFEGEFEAYVDRSPPAVEVLQPSEGAPVCIGPNENGEEVFTLAVQAFDRAPLLEFDGEARSGDGPWLPLESACPREQCPEGKVRTGSLQSLPWRAAPFESGEYTARVGFCDASGNRSTVERRFRVDRSPATVTLVSRSSTVFSPNEDGQLDAFTATFRTLLDAELDAVVRRGGPSGAVVRVLESIDVSGGVNVPLTWDGRDDTGAVVSDGEYVLQVGVLDGCGGGGSRSVSVQVDRAPPVVALTSPAPGEHVPYSLDVTGSVGDAHLATWELSVGEGESPASWAILASHRHPVDSGVLARWDPPSVAGPYTLRLRAVDQAENQSSEARVTVTVGPSQLLARLAATPALFSPNGDGLRDTTTLEYELKAPASVWLEVREGSQVIRSFEAGGARPAGTSAYVWDGLTDAGAPASERQHHVVIRVEGPGDVVEEQEIAATVDRTPPEVTVGVPAPGEFLSRERSVVGSVTDVNLEAYTVTALPDGGSPSLLGEGTRSLTEATLARLEALADGPHTLLVHATDGAGNTRSVEVPFTADSVRPAVGLTEPAYGTVFARRPEPVFVTGRVEDANLASRTLRFAAGAEPGEDPSVWIDVPLEDSGDGVVKGSWFMGSLPDGFYTLALAATDRATLTSDVWTLVAVDSTNPTAALIEPGPGDHVREPLPILGTARDANLSAWVIEASPGPAATAQRWTVVAQGTEEVDEDVLAAWNPLPPDGTHTLRLTVKDRAGFTASALQTVVVDRTPPAAPGGLGATVERTGETARVRLAWSANAEPDLAGYLVLRDGEDLAETLPAVVQADDPDRTDGRYVYEVVAVDEAGNASLPARLEVRVDLTPPAVDLFAPAAAAVVSGSVDVRGTAFSAGDFEEYRLLVGEGEAPAAWTLLRRSTVPVVAGSLGSWTAFVDGPHTLALEAKDKSGNEDRVTRTVVVDAQAPDAPVLVEVRAGAAPDELVAVWDPSPSGDVEGYLVYRNGQLANSPGIVLGDLRGFAVPGPSYADTGLPDGRHCYRVAALDGAANASPTSNEICQALDNRPPRAVILQPEAGTRFGFPVRVVADTPDTDVAWLQFQIRGAGGPEWTDLGTARAARPFETTLDPAPLEPGDYDLRALARDEGGREDPAPEAVRVTYGDVTPPEPPHGLTALVDGDTVTLAWQAGGETDLTEYRVFRDGSAIAVALADPAWPDAGVALGTHEYVVTAVDGDGNESRPSLPAEAIVYRPALDPPAWPVAGETVALTGTGARAGTTVRILRADVPVGEAPAVGEAFSIAGVALDPGGNVLHARGEDGVGNRSLPSNEVRVISNAPPADVTGLVATLDGSAIDLAWDAVGDPDLFGYLVRRGSEDLTQEVRQTEAAQVSASLDTASAHRAFDGDLDTAWRAFQPGAAWTVRFPEPVLVERLHLDLDPESLLTGYEVWADWDGLPLLLVRVRDNLERRADHVFPAPFATGSLTVVLESQGGLAEVEVYRREAVPAGTTAFRDETAPDGVHSYRVAAVDRYGARGGEGEVAVPVGDVSPPAPPAGLSATVAGRDVLLAWTPSPDADVVRYLVLRDGSAVAASVVPSHRDAGLRPATYAYAVVAVDGAGNESGPSEPAEAAVTAQAPEAPVILVPTDAAHPVGLVEPRTDVAGRADAFSIVGLEVNGETLGYTQASPQLIEAPARDLPFSRETAVSPDGRWLAVEASGEDGFEVQLHGLEDGTVQAYAPEGYDRFGSLRFSADSRRLAVVGRSQQPFRRDLLVVDLEEATVQVAYSGSVDEHAWSPQGDRLLVSTAEGETLIVEVDSGDARAVGSRPPFTADRHFRWSPDGRYVAFARQWDETAELLLLEPVSGRVTRLDWDPGSYDPSWSPDGRRLAYTASAPSGLRVVVRDVGAWTVARTIGEGSESTFGPRFDPSGRWLSFVRSVLDADEEERSELVLEDLATGVRTGAPLEQGVASPFLHEWAGEQVLVRGRGQLGFFRAFAGFRFEDVALSPGDNVLVARAFDVDSDLESLPSEPVLVSVDDWRFPDLEISDLRSYPAVPLAGERVSLSARVTNQAFFDLEEVEVGLSVVGPDGRVVLEQTAQVSWLPPWEEAVVSATWTADGPGRYLLRASADPRGEVVESSEANNEVTREVVVTAEPGLALGLEADRPAYGAASPVVLDVRVANSGDAFAGTLRTTVEDPEGREVALLDERPLQLPYGAENAFAVGWNTGAVYAGDYVFRVRALEGDEERAVASRAFRVLPETTVSVRLVPDRPVVSTGSRASFVARVENLSPNVPIGGASARLQLRPEGSVGPAEFEADRAVPALVPGAVWEASFAWPQAAPAGRHVADLELRDASGAALGTARAQLLIEDVPGNVVGAVVVQPAGVLAGQPAEARLSVVNQGTASLPAFPLVVEVTAGPSASVLQQWPFQLDLGPGSVVPATVSLETSGLSPGRYGVRLREGAAPRTLASAVLAVHGPIAAPSVDSPADGGTVTTSHPTLRVNNASGSEGIPLLYEFALFADAPLTVPLPGAAGVPETPARTSWTVASQLGEDRTFYWRARATDGFSGSPWSAVASFTVDALDLPPTAPVPDAPLPGARVASRQPLLTVRNARDPEGRPLTYDFRLSTDAEMSQVVASVSGTPEGEGLTSWLVPLLLDENATYFWSTRALDSANASPWSVPVSFQVDLVNESPSAPSPRRPIGGDDVGTATPALVAGSALDPEGDPLTYRFQLDAAPSFDSPELQVSGDVVEAVPETEWTPPAPLVENTLYYWRVAAFDGSTPGPWASETFFVNTRNDPPGVPVLLEPADGAVVGTPSPTLRLRNTTDADRDDLTYEFAVTDETGSVVAGVAGVPAGVLETEWTVTAALAEDGLFSWSARADDGEQAGEWSAPAAFRVNAVLEPPTAPVPVSPAEGEVVDVRRPGFVVANASSPEGLSLTYSFELYAAGAGGEETLVEAVDGVPEGEDTTSWAPSQELADGGYAWRSRASDPDRHGPWTSSVRFLVAVDAPPAPPTGLRAVPGDGQVSLEWDASPESDVTGYAVHRGTTAGGPYVPVAATTTPSYLDGGLVNGVTVYYVVTARDTSLESGYSSEVAATPVATPPAVVVAEVRVRPAAVGSECLLRGAECGDRRGHGRRGRTDHHHAQSSSSSGTLRPILECVVENGPADFTAFFGYLNEDDDEVSVGIGWKNRFQPEPRGRGQATRFVPGRTPSERPAFSVRFDGNPLAWTLKGRTATASSGSNRCAAPPATDGCPGSLYVSVELPEGLDPVAIDVASVRLLGSIPADPAYAQLGDVDGDGLAELELRFPFTQVRSQLSPGDNLLTVTGRAGSTEFRGSANLTVDPLAVNLWVTPRTLSRKSKGKSVKARLTFRDPIDADDVDVGSLRLNDCVRVKRVVSSHGRELLLEFSRSAVLGVLPSKGKADVWITGRVHGLTFEARDSIEVKK